MTDRVALLLALGAVAVGTRAAPVAALPPVADAYVTAAAPRESFGRKPMLEVAARPVTTAYLRFRVTVPTGTQVSRATLRLHASTGSSAGFAVYRVADTAWRESALTFANAPRLGPRLAVSLPGDRGTGYVSVDVTPLVTVSGLVSVAVKGLSSRPVVFGSREARAGRPILVVETSATAGGGTAAACGTAAGSPPQVRHVIWIWMENKPYDSVIGSPSAPFENQLAAGCALATSYHGVAHPSLPNYVAATSGGTQGIADDADPATHPLDVPSIFGQVKAAGGTWRAYEESSPGYCPQTSSGAYAVRHDPAAYYTGIRADCASWDEPMGTPSAGSFASDLASGNLPSFAFVTPDMCNDTHDCSVATGDAWLQGWFAKILASPSYRAGDTAVFVVWDEDDLASGNHIPLIAVNPSIPPGTQAAATYDHYSLLKTTEQLLGLPFLGHAADPATPSMVSAFNLG